MTFCQGKSGRICEPHINLKKILQAGEIIVIEVAEGDEKPYSCSSGYFRRLDAVTQKMTQKEVGLVFRNAVTFPWEERIHVPKISSNGFFFIEFERPKRIEKVTERVTENQRKIIEAISKDHNITIAELSQIVAISERKIKTNILKLKGKGLLRRVGPDKGGHWEVIE